MCLHCTSPWRGSQSRISFSIGNLYWRQMNHDAKGVSIRINVGALESKPSRVVFCFFKVFFVSFFFLRPQTYKSHSHLTRKKTPSVKTLGFPKPSNDMLSHVYLHIISWLQKCVDLTPRQAMHRKPIPCQFTDPAKPGNTPLHHASSRQVHLQHSHQAI